MIGFFYCATTLAQYDTTIKTSYFKQVNIYFNNLNENHQKEDSTLENHFNYTSPDFNGNLALPSQEILLENKLQTSIGFRYINPNYKNHFYTKNDISFYNTKTPYTRAFVLVGQRQEQIMRLLHTQNIKQFNYMLKFNRYKCNGFYKQQTAVNDNFIGTINYSAKNTRYNLFASLLYNKLKHKENGGIKYDTAFATNQGFLLNKQLFDVNLQDAKRVTKNMNIELINKFKLNKDTSSKKENYIFCSTAYSSDFFVYQDNQPQSGFYKQIYFDSLLTLDSTTVSKFTNQVGYSCQLKNKIKTEFFLTIKNELICLKQFVTDSVANVSLTPISVSKIHFDSTFKNTLIVVGAHSKLCKSDIIGNAEYIFVGSNKGDYSLSFNFLQQLNWKKSILKLSAYSDTRTQDLFYNWHHANNFNWQNFLNKKTTTQFFGEINTLNGLLKLETLNRITSNFVYFDSLLLPLIYTAPVLVSRVAVSANLKFWKIYFNNKINYQLTDNKNIVRLPNYVLESQLFYNAKLFKNNLQLQIGAQLTYYSAFKANAYIPATNQYYIQNANFYGNYPFVDFFINAEIKPVRFFFKIDHLNQGLNGANYLLTPNMPMPDRAFKFGFTWLFWD